MGDLEFFGGSDTGSEGMDPAAFERFKEKMRRAAAQIKAIRKQEQKQKKSEDEIAKVLSRFLKSRQKQNIMQLVVRLLEQNVPAVFIVNLISIAVQSVQDDLKIKLLPNSVTDDDKKLISGGELDEFLPAKYIEDDVLPLKIKVAVVKWIDLLFKASLEKPRKLLKTIQTVDGKITNTAIQCGAFCLRDFLDANGIQVEYAKLRQFSSFILKDIVHKLKESAKNKKIENKK